MGDQGSLSSRLEALIEKGEGVLATHKPNPPGAIGFPTLDSGAFAEWRTQTTAFLNSVVGSDHPYTTSFVEKVEKPYKATAKAGIGILRAVKEDVDAGLIGTSEPVQQTDPLSRLTHLGERFHIVARQLRSRYADRPTLDVKDEYDVQKLLHALLHAEETLRLSRSGPQAPQA